MYIKFIQILISLTEPLELEESVNYFLQASPQTYVRFKSGL